MAEPSRGHAPARGAARRYRQRFGADPAGIWRAPGRVNLIGEHTDYNDGFALPFAIDASVCVAADRTSDGALTLTSCQEPDDLTVSVAGLVPGSVPGWAAYPAGVVWSLRAAGYQIQGASIAVDATLTPGGGLSSSAALECAVAIALTELHGISLTRPELAGLARRAENEFVGAPTGIMDQLAVLTCAKGHALLLDCRAGTGTQVPFDPAAAGLNLVVIDTRAKHELTDSGYAARRAACEAAARTLGVGALRDIDDVARLGVLADPVLLRRARHVVTENRRVGETVRLLGAGQLAGIGPLLTASHRSLRDDFEVSWPQADVAVRASIDAGALGARMVGGGFGGAVIALIPDARVGEVTGAVQDGFAARGWLAPTITSAVPSASASRVR